jgi:hypothetical protein
MKKIILGLLIIMLSVPLAGCPFTKEIVVYKNNYILKEIPPDMLEEPEPVPYLDIDSATLTQKDVSDWAVKHGIREFELADKLYGIKELQNKYRSEVEELNKGAVKK